MNWAIQFVLAAALGLAASLGVTAAVTSRSTETIAPLHIAMDITNLPESQNVEDRRDDPPMATFKVWRVALYVYCETCGNSTDEAGKPVDIYLYKGIAFGTGEDGEAACHDYLASPATEEFKNDLMPFLRDLALQNAKDPSFDVYVHCREHEEPVPTS